jgi:hypothetical protein
MSNQQIITLLEKLQCAIWSSSDSITVGKSDCGYYGERIDFIDAKTLQKEIDTIIQYYINDDKIEST